MPLNFKPVHMAAFSTDGRGSYSIQRIIDHWMATYIERGEEPADLYDGESYEDAVAACVRHDDAAKLDANKKEGGGK